MPQKLKYFNDSQYNLPQWVKLTWKQIRFEYSNA